MAEFYAVQIRLGRITIDDVPARLANAVAVRLEGLEGGAQ